jgi:hypothetical protein
MRLSKETLWLIIPIPLIVTGKLLLPNFSTLGEVLSLIGFVLLILNLIPKVTGNPDKPRNKVALLYGGFGVLIGGGVLVAITSLNSAFFLPPCLIGLFMIFLYLRNNAQKAQDRIKS